MTCAHSARESKPSPQKNSNTLDVEDTESFSRRAEFSGAYGVRRLRVWDSKAFTFAERPSVKARRSFQSSSFSAALVKPQIFRRALLWCDNIEKKGQSASRAGLPTMNLYSEGKRDDVRGNERG